jgi:molybdopterin/thiamine biosynthesis adenylyltransferase
MNIVIIGLGGIGSHLVRPLCRYLSELKDEVMVTLIDGDMFEPKNENRQEFSGFGNKAEVLAAELADRYSKLGISGKAWYITAENAYVAINKGDIVFCCVDNHATRSVVSERCQELEDMVLISGGNEYSDGNVQVFIRKEGTCITPALTHFHPEIENPQDKNPGEMSCEELAKSGSPQLIFTNLLVSAWMLTTFWKYLVWKQDRRGSFDYSEIYFDGMTGNARSVNRS